MLNPAPVSRDLTSSSLATVSRINQDDGPFRNPSPEKSLQLTQEKRASEAPKKSSNVAVVEAGVGFGDTSRSTNGADEALNATAFAGDLTLPLSSVGRSKINYIVKDQELKSEYGTLNILLAFVFGSLGAVGLSHSTWFSF